MSNVLLKFFEFILPYVVEFLRQLLENYLGSTATSYHKQEQFLKSLEDAADNAHDKKKADKLKSCVKRSRRKMHVQQFKKGF